MRKVFGIGVNDAEYETQRFVKGSEGKWKCVWVCPFYKAWKHMLERCFCPKLKRKYPTYEDVTCVDEWLYFSRFKSWMEIQHWEGKALDKDILNSGNLIYSPDNCIFIPKNLNNFLTNTQRTKISGLPLGVCWNGDHRKYQVRVNNPFTKRRENLGYFDGLPCAMSTYNKRKGELATLWAEVVEDERLKQALLNMKHERFKY